MQTVMDLPDELLSQVEAAAGAAGQTTGDVCDRCTQRQTGAGETKT